MSTDAHGAKREVFWAFQRGFKHGVCANAVDPRFTEHDREDIRLAYGRGYNRGRDISMIEMASECDRIGYDPRLSILRSQPPADPPGSAA